MKKKDNRLGGPIKIINTTGYDMFCAETGLKLPRRGMAWKHSDQLFMSRYAAESWDKRES
jgi:hypothetical protein